ncbi:MAG: hypothetical protein H0T85_09215 [Geodermatophilaceae bacterium]|nr:hypothetical protein [Geodermatophilaceae bacterium]
MLIIVACAAALLVGLLAAVRWGGERLDAPPRPATGTHLTGGEVVRRYLWWATVATVAALGAGLFAGVGGRLVMRLLAATSPEARGRITDAGEVVGDISVDGTIGLIVFGGVFAGVLCVVPYLLLRRWLPPGYLGGASFGLLALLLVGTRRDPLRPDNVDFTILGPDWAALLTFAALAVAFGVLMAALAARFGRSLPLLATPLRATDRRTLLRYWPLLVLVALLPLAAIVLVVGVVAVLVGPLLPATDGSGPSRRLVLAGRIALAFVVLVSLPTFVSDVDTILRAS